MSPMFRRVTTGVAAAAATLLVAAPALAHPSFNPNTVTPGESHLLSFVIPHGCVPGGGAPVEGQEASPTIAVSVKVPSDQVASIAPFEIEGWKLSSQASQFTWAAPTAPTTEPISFQIQVEVLPNAGEVIYFTVAQDCEEGSTLWIAEDGKEGDPAAVLFVGDAVGTTDRGDGTEHGGTEDAGPEDTAPEDTEHAPEDDATADGEHAESEGAAPLDGGLVILVVLLLAGGLTAIMKMD